MPYQTVNCWTHFVVDTNRTRVRLRPMLAAASNMGANHNRLLIFYLAKLPLRWIAILLVATEVIVAFCGIPFLASAAPLSSNKFTALASRCAPGVPVTTLEAVARTESDLDPWVLHNDTTGQTENPASFDLANKQAKEWIGSGESVDIGLMQINSANLGALGMTITKALNPCASLAGGAAVLQAAYGGGNTNAEQQAALLMALSRYDTGSPLKGIMNGYVRRVLDDAGTEEVPAPQEVQRVTTRADVPPPWNISADGVYAQTHGAPWLIDLNAPSAAVKPQKLAAMYGGESLNPTSTR
ncbi:transglycosylase SLT domain-containing protein [Acidocella facilis]|uniref:transglycosylase SLT domain-containing protein n=1 Tax=Acidocella facilis TaxID=525 RepID=UPI001F318C60|nr:transglycosylase SLT domain-containing protein [Acidocella facilis]